MIYALILCITAHGATDCQLAAQSYSSLFREERACLAAADQFRANRWWRRGVEVRYECAPLQSGIVIR